MYKLVSLVLAALALPACAQVFDLERDACRLKLPPNVHLTLLTDGIAEARNASGELFGFDRTAAISAQSAQEVARAAQQFGQEDDITVLTLKFEEAEMRRA